MYLDIVPLLICGQYSKCWSMAPPVVTGVQVLLEAQQQGAVLHYTAVVREVRAVKHRGTLSTCRLCRPENMNC
jgi:hypothetical protein